MAGRHDKPSGIASTPAWFLDRSEELRMQVSDEKLIAEAVEVNHAKVSKADA
jgi:hypothetical protein